MFQPSPPIAARSFTRKAFLGAAVAKGLSKRERLAVKACRGQSIATQSGVEGENDRAGIGRIEKLAFFNSLFA